MLSLSGGLTKEKDPLMEARVPIAPGFDEVWFYFAAGGFGILLNL